MQNTEKNWYMEFVHLMTPASSSGISFMYSGRHNYAGLGCVNAKQKITTMVTKTYSF